MATINFIVRESSPKEQTHYFKAEPKATNTISAIELCDKTAKALGMTKKQVEMVVSQYMTELIQESIEGNTCYIPSENGNAASTYIIFENNVLTDKVAQDKYKAAAATDELCTQYFLANGRARLGIMVSQNISEELNKRKSLHKVKVVQASAEEESGDNAPSTDGEGTETSGGTKRE